MFDDYRGEGVYGDLGTWDQLPECKKCGKPISLMSDEELCVRCLNELTVTKTL